MVLAFILLVISSCKESPTGTSTGLTEFPEVRTTQTNYSQGDIYLRVPDTALFNRFNRVYSGKYSDELKALLVDHIVGRARELGFSENESRECLHCTGQLESGVISLPYLAERARYDSTDAWIYEFTWGPYKDLGHYRCFVMGALTHDTLLYITCR